MGSLVGSLPFPDCGIFGYFGEVVLSVTVSGFLANVGSLRGLLFVLLGWLRGVSLGDMSYARVCPNTV